ncbi:MAG: sulfotransferase [Pseudomonadota bacterium]
MPTSQAEQLSRLIQINRNRPSVRSWAQQADLALKMNDMPAAQVALEALVALKPDNPDYWNALGNVRKRQGDSDQAVAHYQRCLDLSPSHRAAVINHANALLNLHRHEDVVKSLESHLAGYPRDTDALYTLGYAHQQLGNFKGAKAAYQKAQKAEPDHARCLAELLSVEDYQAGDSLLDKSKSLLRSSTLGSDDRIRLCFAIGAFSMRHKRYEQAFAFYDEGNALLRQSKPPYRLPTRASSVFLPRLDAQKGSSGPRPLFILGLPRSGTSLLDQMLACHSAITSVGELNVAADLIKRAIREHAQAGPQALMRAGQFARETYLAALQKRTKGASSYTVDKSLDLPLALPELKALFPEAKFVVLSRDLRDVALSCYTTAFNFSNDYTTDFGRFFSYADMVTGFLDHQAAHDADVFSLRYEDLASDPKTSLEAALNFLSLPFEAECLNHHKARRVVRTESFWQVRQPVYTSAIGRWRTCETQLKDRHPRFCDDALETIQSGQPIRPGREYAQ